MDGFPDANELSRDDFERLDRILGEFRGACAQATADTPLPRFDSFLPARNDTLRTSALWRLIDADIDSKRDRGERILLDSYLEHLGPDYSLANVPAALVVSEYCARTSLGESPPMSEFRSRFPQQYDQFERLLTEQGFYGTIIPKFPPSESSASNKLPPSLTDTPSVTSPEETTVPEDPVDSSRDIRASQVSKDASTLGNQNAAEGKSRLKASASSVWTAIEGQLERFFEAWQDAPPPPEIAVFVSEFRGSTRRLLLVELIKVDLEYRWADVTLSKPIDSYFQDWPELKADSAVMAELVYEEIHQREQAGHEIDMPDYLKRYANVADDLKRCAGISDEDKKNRPPELQAHPPGVMPETVGEGRYKLHRLIGGGAFGEVWLGEAPGGIEVAIKIIRFPLGHHMTQQEERALELMKKMNHPFLIQVQSYWEEGEKLIIVMDLADKTLADRYRECKQQGIEGIPHNELFEYIRTSGEALDFLHSRDVIHRDVKPANILLSGDFAKVGDFGIARVLERHDVSIRATVAGTPLYTAPEMFDGKPCPQSDQYALAVSYVELRTGRPPLVGDSVLELMKAHISRPPEVDTLDERERPVVLRALSKQPSERYPSCAGFAHALAEAMREEPAKPEKRRFPIAMVGLAAIAIAMVGVAIALMFPGKTANSILLPPDCEKAVGAQLVTCFDLMNRQLYDEVELVLRSGRRIPLRLVPSTPGNRRDPPTFYIMKNKVSNELYEDVTGGSTRDKCSVNFAPQPLHPVFCVTAVEAHGFAVKIGGQLPTPAQWDKASGEFDAPAGTVGPFNATGENGTGRRELGPMFVGEAEGAKSRFLVNDMSGNGYEWTDEVYWNNENRLLSDVAGQLVKDDGWASVTIRGQSFAEESPYQFSARKELPVEVSVRDPETSFRVVVKIKSVGTDGGSP